MSDPTDITRLLAAWRDGNAQAQHRLIELLYDDLKRIAIREFSRERAGHTLQPTALVNEAILRIAGAQIDWDDRCHFLALMTTTMRRVLVDHARARGRQRRGGDVQHVTLTTAQIAGDAPGAELLDLVNAIDALRNRDERKASMLEHYYFAGMTYDEIATVTGLSAATVDRELRFSRSWLQAYLNDPESLSKD